MSDYIIDINGNTRTGNAPIHHARAAWAMCHHRTKEYIALMRAYADAEETYLAELATASEADLNAYEHDTPADLGIGCSRARWQRDAVGVRLDAAQKAVAEAETARFLAVGCLPWPKP